MPAYLIANVRIKDFQKIKDYQALTPAAIAKFGGRFLARGGEVWVAEGNWKPERLVIVEFESMQKAKEFYDSEEYQPLLAMRKSAADTDLLLVDGVTLG